MGPQLRLGYQGSKDPSIPVKAQSSAGPLHRGPEIARLHLTGPQVWVRVGDQGGYPEPVPFLGGAPSMPMNFPHNEPVTPTLLESGSCTSFCLGSLGVPDPRSLPTQDLA